jgi:hypothetical protein
MKLTGENRQLGEKPVPVALCPPQTPHGHPGSNPGLLSGRPATNRLSHGTSSNQSYSRHWIIGFNAVRFFFGGGERIWV